MSEIEELDLLIDHRQRTLDFLAAKEAAQAASGDEAAQAAWREQKYTMRDWRRQWREVRDAFAVEPGEGDAVASPDTVGLKAKGN